MVADAYLRLASRAAIHHIEGMKLYGGSNVCHAILIIMTANLAPRCRNKLGDKIRQWGDEYSKKKISYKGKYRYGYQ